MVSHCLSPYTCKCCIVFKQFDGLKFDGLAGKRQKVNISPTKLLSYTVIVYLVLYLHICTGTFTLVHVIKPLMVCTMYCVYTCMNCALLKMVLYNTFYDAHFKHSSQLYCIKQLGVVHIIVLLLYTLGVLPCIYV